MDNILKNIVDLVNKALLSDHGGIYILQWTPSEEEKHLLTVIKESDCIEEITSDGKVIDVSEITLKSSIKVELVHHSLQSYGYYHDIEAFINTNEFSAPDKFYIKELEYLHPSTIKNEFLESYFTIVSLIKCMSSLALFVSEELIRTIYLMQDKSAVTIPLIYNKSLIQSHHPNLDNIKSFVTDVNGHTERKKIFTKELIDFLGEENDESQRFSQLFIGFDRFHQKCEAAYAFFLSDFSYSKLKLELESAILDYSKNIRAIINDSQTKLIAIPAAFIVGSSQLDLDNEFSLKNFLIIISSFVFSILIEIFLRNQESSVKIFKDNINTYKTTFSLKNMDIGVKESKTLQTIIKTSFKAVDEELKNQFQRLKWIRVINWGMSIFLVLLVTGLTFSALFKSYHLSILITIILKFTCRSIL